MMTTRQLFALALLGLLTLKVNAHEDEPNLHLGSVKSFQVSASINAPSGAGLSLEALQAPFIDVLQKRGKKIDQNNYDNDVSAEVQIAGSGSQYAVEISFSYREPCVANRLKLQLTCPIWEHYELLQMFSSLNDAVGYTVSAAKSAAQLFDAEFDRR
jgi:hypothetical protein